MLIDDVIVVKMADCKILQYVFDYFTTCTPVDVQQVDVSEVGVLDFYYPFCALVQF